MAGYVVLTPPDGKRADEKTVLIRDGFAVVALIIPVIWLLWHRLWFAAMMLFLVSTALYSAIAAFPDQALVFTASSVLLSLFVALEGNGWRVAKKERQGWTLQGVVDAPDYATAEEIWFAGAAAPANGQSATRAPPPALGRPAQSGPPKTASGPALGLLDYGDRN
ncbi:MAG: DUF2628 domain-containing protein [Pseudomonadota bacterium]